MSAIGKRIHCAGENGEDGTIISVEDGLFKVRLDDGSRIAVPEVEYEILSDGEYHAKFT